MNNIRSLSLISLMISALLGCQGNAGTKTEQETGSVPSSVTTKGSVKDQLLRYKFTKGQKFEIKITDKINTLGTINGFFVSTSMTVDDYVLAEVKAVDAKGWTSLHIKKTRYVLRSSSFPANNTQYYDTSSPKLTRGSVRKEIQRLYQGLVGQEIALTVDPRGLIKKFEPLNQKAKDAQARNVAKVKGEGKGLLPILPKDRVELGSFWNIEQTTTLPKGAITIRMKYTFKGKDKRGGKDIVKITGVGVVGYSKAKKGPLSGLKNGKVTANIELNPISFVPILHTTVSRQSYPFLFGMKDVVESKTNVRRWKLLTPVQNQRVSKTPAQQSQPVKPPTTVQKSTAKRLIDEGRRLGLAGKTNEALQLFREAVRVDPTNATAHHAVGGALINLRRPKEALSAFQEAARLDPNSAEHPVWVGIVLVQLKRRPEALKATRKAVALEPNWYFAHYRLALILDGSGRLREAVDHYRRAVELNPDEHNVRKNLYLAAKELGGPKLLVQVFKKLVSKHRKHAHIWNCLGMAESDAGNYAKSAEYIKKAIAVDPENGSFYGGLGLVQLRLRRYKEAVEAYERSLQLLPENDWRRPMATRQLHAARQALRGGKFRIDANPARTFQTRDGKRIILPPR